MFRWTPYAMVRILLFFGAGVIAAIFIPELSINRLVVIFAAGLLLLYFIVIAFRQLRFIQGCVGLLCLAVAGFIHTRWSNETTRTDHFIHQSDIESFQVVITRFSEKRGHSWRTRGEVTFVKCKGEWKKTSGNVLLYFPSGDFKLPPRYGDQFLVHGAPALLKPPLNPGEFDFQRFMGFQNVFHQTRINVSDVLLIDHHPPSQFIDLAIRTRLWAEEQINRYVSGEQERATANALVLGVTDGLDQELLGAYSATGAVHILAVSGLHVSVIYWIILLIFRPLDKTSKGRWILAFISLFILWSYAFISGWSPSVLRAVTMFSFVGLARPWRKGTNIYNTMASSAFCLLLYDPYFIMSVGFQLSYLAVIGIVYLHPRLYALWEPDARLPDEIWKVISVSIAAQAMTLPITLFYFHQFPNYFLVANILAIPISFAVLILGVALLPASFVSIIGTSVGFLLSWSIKIMNFIIVMIGDWPGSVTHYIFIDALQAWLLAGILICIAVTIVNASTKFLQLGFCFAITFAGLDWHHRLSTNKARSITVYHVPGKAVMEINEGGTIQQFGFNNRCDFQTLSLRLANGFSGNWHLESSSPLQVLDWHDLRIIRIDSSATIPRIEADLVIISRNAIRDSEQLNKINCDKIIFDSSNSAYFVRRLLQDSRVYSVQHHGAFHYSLSDGTN